MLADFVALSKSIFSILQEKSKKVRKIIKPNSLPRLLLWARAIILIVACLATSFIHTATIYCHQKMHIHTNFGATQRVSMKKFRSMSLALIT